MDLHESFESLRNELEKMGFDPSILAPEEPNADMTYWVPESMVINIDD